jgi:c-di-GMP-related signal transduction protein
MVQNPMPATQEDIDELKRLLKWSRTARSGVAKEQVLVSAIEKALSYLEQPDGRRNVILFCLSALRQSVRKGSDKTNVWYVTDHVLYDWAMEQIHEMFSH